VNKAVFLDRDGTINIDRHYIYKPEDWEFTENAVDAIKMLNTAGYKVIVISNQSGIARGYYTQEDVQNLHRYVNAELAKQGTKIDAWYFCPHLPEISGECECRKPKTGLIRQAVKDFDIDISKSWLVGDKQSDIECANNAELKGILIGNNNESRKYGTLFDSVEREIVNVR
jgi:D-glycero-D-manno-heptose 1,7-bisphosphate phosphatase